MDHAGSGEAVAFAADDDTAETRADGTTIRTTMTDTVTTGTTRGALSKGADETIRLLQEPFITLSV